MQICGASHYVQPVTDDHLPSLKQALLEATGQSIRRIDRFIQLSLLGAGRCCRGQSLPPGTALYLTSERGDIEVTVDIFESIHRDKHPPSPLHFVNSVSNAACFYLATGLQLQGSSHFLATHRFSFERALKLALLDIQSERTDTALVGHVDVCVPPLVQHRIRIGVAPDTPVAEATHWLLFRRACDPAHSLGSVRGVYSFANRSEWSEWLSRYPRESDTLTIACGLGLEEADLALLDKALPDAHRWTSDIDGAKPPYYDGWAAGNGTAFTLGDTTGELLHMAKDMEGRYGAYRILRA